MDYRDRRCPHCGRTNGLFVKRNLKDILTLYDFNGNETEDNMDEAYSEGGKKMYCQVCQRFVCKITDYKKKYGSEN